MTSAIPPEDPRPTGSSDRRRYDELIAVVVALLGIGSVFYWATRQPDPGFDASSWLSTAPAAAPSIAVTPAPDANRPPAPEASPTSPEPSPTVSPAPTSPTPTQRFVPVPAPVPATPPVAASPQPTSSPKDFVDVPADFWAAPFINALAQRNIIAGFEDNTFQPNKPVTRAEFASMLNKAFDRPTTRQLLTFGDVSADYWGRSAIDESVKMGFMNGYPNRQFEPDQQIPRAQVFTAIVTGLGLNPTAPGTEVVKIYKDAARIPNYAVDKVAAATQSNLVVNYPDRTQLNPRLFTTRADAAALIYQALAREGKAPPIESPYIVQP